MASGFYIQLLNLPQTSTKVSYSYKCLGMDLHNKTGNEEAFFWKNCDSFLAFPLQFPNISSNSVYVGFNLGYSTL